MLFFPHGDSTDPVCAFLGEGGLQLGASLGIKPMVEKWEALKMLPPPLDPETTSLLRSGKWKPTTVMRRQNGEQARSPKWRSSSSRGVSWTDDLVKSLQAPSRAFDISS